jgi:predicted metalloprotease
MRWTPGGVSSDIEDGRGGGGGFGGFGGGQLGCGGAVILLVLSLLFGRNFFTLVGPSQTASPPPAAARAVPPTSETPQEHKQVQFVSFVLDDVQATWDRLLPQESKAQYHHAKLHLFRDATQSGCGFAQAASGPFYCPEDERVYVDLSFYDELQSRFGAPGEFAQAYVLAHEVGHHVQNILGITEKVHSAMQSDPQNANSYSEKLELQADCLAGVWGNTTQQRNMLDPGDIDSGLAAAAAVGDDRLQRMAGRRVNPETWTHGSSAERVSWFRRGFQSGHISACDTFK